MLMTLVLVVGVVTSASAALPAGWNEADDQMALGSASWDYSNGVWTITGRGGYGKFVYKSLNGDGSITARLRSLTDTWPGPIFDRPHIFVSIRKNPTSLEQTQSGFAVRAETGILAANGTYEAAFQYYHETTGSGAGGDVVSLPYWVRVDRRGNTFRGYVSPNGSPNSWTLYKSEDIAMGQVAFVGLHIWIGGDIQFAATLDNVTVEGDTGPATGGSDNAWRVSGSNMYSLPSGNVGIGTSNPTYKLDVVGTTATDVLVIRGGADLAEPFSVTDAKRMPAGALMVIDEKNPGHLKLSDRPYDKRVAGVVSGAGGLSPGLTLTQKGIIEGGVKVALTGRVYAVADASNGGIEPGDLLTTSAVPGHAMKATDRDRSYGAVIGKAMSPLKKGRGLVLVLVSLQ